MTESQILPSDGYVFQAVRTTENRIALVNRKDSQPMGFITIKADTYLVHALDGTTRSAPQFSLDEAFNAANYWLLKEHFGDIPVMEYEGHAEQTTPAPGMLSVSTEPKSSIDLKMTAKGERYWDIKSYYDQATPGARESCIQEIVAADLRMFSLYPNTNAPRPLDR